ncbi:MAG: hypothetical protein KKI09_08790 [Spirochaetes bacterium]|nr:hypothetical protein [Spirochaetota bacterium]MBU0955508.1 hypothetical protein [Spirochaetota bacterium]
MVKNNIKAGERRSATILFADMKGFTSLSERMDPEEMDALMNRVFGTFETIIKNNGGFVEKYIGDALVAVFGVPEIHEDDPVRALDSALEFLKLNSSMGRDGSGNGPELQFRVGIHSGLITTGVRGDYDVVTGHAMAIAQRLQDLAPAGGILVSDPVKEHCDSEYLFAGPQSLSLKGKRDTLQAWLLKGAVSGEAGDSGVYIGRAEILDEILRLYIKDDNKVLTGRYITSEPGMGKTRFVNALLERIKRFPDFSAPVLKAKAQKYRSARYSLACDLIVEYFGLSVYDPPQLLRKALTAVRGIESSHIDRFMRLLASSEGSPVDPDIILSLFSIFQAIMEQYSDALYSCLVYIDNAQDLDRLSREFFQYYFKHGRIKPFLLMAGRDYPRVLRDAFPDLKPVKLRPLDNEESRELARTLCPDCPPQLLDMIVAQSMGNPLFIREYSQYARKNKDLNVLPDTIQNIFLTSLDRYDPASRDLLKKLSAYVHHFTLEDAQKIQTATNASPALVDKALRRFLQDGILSCTGTNYSFVLDVFRKALYASLLNHNKRIIHGVIADIILQRPNPHRVRLIIHLMRSERWAEAADQMLNDSARNYTYDYLPHIDALYRNLAKAAPDVAIQLLLLKGALLFNSGRTDEAEQELKRIMQIAVSERNDVSLGFAYYMICAFNNMSYSFQKTSFTGQKALFYSRRSKRSARTIQGIVHYLSIAEMHRANFDEARSLIEETRELEDFDPFQYGRSLGEYYLLAGEYHKALDTIETYSDSSDRNYSQVARFYGLDLRLKILWQLCDYEALGVAARRLLDAGELSRASICQAHALLALSQTLVSDYKSAAESFSQAEFYVEQIYNEFDRMDALRNLSQCHMLAGNEAAAEQRAMEALALGLRHSCTFPAFTACLTLVQVNYRKGQLDVARFYLGEAAWFFTTGLLLPYKDVILYYFYVGILGEDDENSVRNLSLASTLIRDELSRIQTAALKNNFLAIRGFGEIQDRLSQVQKSEGTNHA